MENDTLMLKHGLDMLVYNCIALIDIDCKETVKTIVEHMYNGDLLTYIINKYDKQGDFSNFTSITPSYSIKDVNDYICEMASYVSGNESRKYCVANEDNGLLLLIAVCYDLGTQLISKLKDEKDI